MAESLRLLFRNLMIPLLTAAANWESETAKALLDSAVSHYRSASRYSCTLRYSCTRTGTSATSGPGTSDSRTLVVKRNGDAYFVRAGDGRIFRGSRAKGDPYMVYDHQLTYLFGYRRETLSKRLAAKGSKGPYYSFFSASPTKVAIYERFVNSSGTPFQLTYVIDPSSFHVLSAGTYVVMAPVGEVSNDTDVLFTESVEFVDQVFG